MDSASVNKRQTAKMRRMLQSLPVVATEGVKKELVQAARRVQRDAVAACPSRRVRAALSDGRAIGRASNGFKVTFGIRTRGLWKKAFFAKFLEFGTKAHSLEPKSKKKQASRSRRGGVRAGYHPGTSAHHFLTRAADSNFGTNRASINKALQIALRTVVRG